MRVCQGNPLPSELTRFSFSQRAAREQSWSSLRVKWLEGTFPVYLCGHLLVTSLLVGSLLISAPVGDGTWKKWINEWIYGIYLGECWERFKKRRHKPFDYLRAAVLAHPHSSQLSAAATSSRYTQSAHTRVHIPCFLRAVRDHFKQQRPNKWITVQTKQMNETSCKQQKRVNTWLRGLFSYLNNILSTDTWKFFVQQDCLCILSAYMQLAKIRDFVLEKGTKTCLMVKMPGFSSVNCTMLLYSNKFNLNYTVQKRDLIYEFHRDSRLIYAVWRPRWHTRKEAPCRDARVAAER